MFYISKTIHLLNFTHDYLYWLTSYLTNRHQYVQIDDRKSKSAPVCFGVPQGFQGSILAPFIFKLIYVSDIDVPQTCHQYMHDDTSLYEHCKTWLKLDYCDTVYSPLHDYQIKRLQRIQNACAGFVKGS